MLNLYVNLMKLRVLLPLLLLLIAAQDFPPVTITSPAPGDILRGQVDITGTMAVLNFLSAQLVFSYASNPGGGWFAIQTFSQPVVDAALTVWDTTLITDGEYILRLRVNLGDGSFQEVTIPVRVQNDAPIVTPTPVVTSLPESIMVQIPTPFLIAASPTPTATQRPTPTALPQNPVSLNQPAIYTSLGRGALVILGLFAFVGIILRLRRY